MIVALFINQCNSWRKLKQIITLTSWCLFSLGTGLAFQNITLADEINVTEINSIKKVQDYRVKDYGIRGHVFPIIEQSLLEIIKEKLATADQEGKLEQLQNEFREKVKSKMMRPSPVQDLSLATDNRSWLYDPEIIQKEEIKDDKGNIIIKAGTKINPLDSLSWGEAFIFIDGDDEKQVAWAKQQVGKIILVNGTPISLSKELDRPVYFDQGGIFIKRFQIKAIPALIDQEGNKLRVREILIETMQ